MLRAFLRSAVCAVLVFTPKLAFSQSVVSTVYPVESLVKSIIHETPIKSDLLLKGPQSPHSYRLKPSDLRVLETADHIFWIGDNFETFLRTPFEKIAQKVPKTSLYQAVVKDTDEHHPSHDGHNEHQNDEEHEEHANAHIWLNPDQVIHSIEIITDVLSHQFPAYQTIFKTNKENFVHRLEDHLTEIKSRFSKLKSVPFIVYHDAYDGFTDYFALSEPFSITPSDHHQIGARRLQEVRAHIKENNVSCIISEPQVNERLIKTITQGYDIKVIDLDILGTHLPKDKDLYFHLLDEIATKISNCLDPSL